MSTRTCSDLSSPSDSESDSGLLRDALACFAPDRRTGLVRDSKHACVRSSIARVTSTPWARCSHVVSGPDLRTLEPRVRRARLPKHRRRGSSRLRRPNSNSSRRSWARITTDGMKRKGALTWNPGALNASALRHR